jgi:signal transduction histidine kinase
MAKGKRSIRARLSGSSVGDGEETRNLPIGTRPFDRLPSIRAKLGAVIVFAVAVTILIMYVAIGFALRTSQRETEANELRHRVEVLAPLAVNPDGRLTPALLRAVGSNRSPVLVVDSTGGTLFRKGGLPVPLTVDRALLGHADTGEIDGFEYFGLPVIRQTIGGPRIVGAVYLAHRIEGGGLAGAAVATVDFVTNYWWQLLLAGAVAAAIALVLARYLARGLTQPLRDMAQAARRMARGHYRQRVEPRTRDEVGQLADAFNRMAGEMEGLERLRRELVANVSHELKTPISALRAHLENLLDGVERPDPAVFQIMLQQSERLSRLVEQLLDLSRIESGDVPLALGPVDLQALAGRVMREVEVARPERHLEVSNEIPPELPPVMADEERIHQVLFNLLDNAFRFTPSGGKVWIRGVRTNGSCEIEVRDTGPGIPKEHLELVFERFYRVDPSRSREDGGTGIGLAIARSVIEAHGGRIWAEETPGPGGSLRFVLPLAGMEASGFQRGDSANSRELAPTQTGSG